MAAQVVLSCLEPFPTHLNPCLDVLIQESHFRRAFNSSGSAVTVLFTPTQLDHPLQRRLLLCAHATAVQTHAPAVQTHAPAVQTHATAVQTHATAVQTADCGGDGPHTPMKVFVTRVFLRHHHLQQNTGGTVRLLTPVALTKVVIGARSRHSFKWANSDKFANGLQVLASSGQVILAREGDVLRLPSHPLLGDDMSLLDLVVLQCAPVTQGRITGGSGVVVTDAWDSPDSVSLARPLTKVLVSDFAHFSNSLCRGGSLLDNSLCRGGSLLDNSLCRGGSLLDNSLCRGGSLLDNRNPLSPSFSDFLRALEGRIDVRVVNVCPLIRQNCLTGKDWDSTVFVSRNLLLKLGLFNHEWVVLSVLNPLEKCVAGVSSRLECLQTIGVEDGEKPLSKVRLASVVVLDFTQCPELEVNDTYGLISTTHWFNLSAGETVPTGTRTLRIKRWNKSPPLAESPPSHSTCRTASPRFATELHIEPIISPDYDSQGCCDDLLTRHFTTARLVAKGDVMAVCSENHAEEKDNISDRDQRCPVRYFKVRKVFGCVADEEEVTGDFLADKRHTSLYLGGSTNSPVPFCWFWGTSSLWSSLAPSGLGSTVDKCINIIQPHLKNRSCTSLGRCNILLQGARGCGKVTSVRAACRRLHLHLVQVNCVSLCADTAASCEVKMRATFQKAEALHPCVLLLRNLQYLGQPREGDDEDSRVQASLFQLLTTTCTRVVVMATVSRPQELSSDVMAAFVHQVAIESASEAQRKAMLAGLTMGVPLAKDVSLDLLAKYTSGFVLGDLRSLLAEAGRTAYRRLQTTCSSMEPWGQLEVDLCSCGVHIQAQDFTAALDTLQESLSQAVGAPKIPSVRWQEVGGLEEVKQEILNTIQLPLERPELLSLGLHRVGLLLYGPPGTGKTLLAKAVATECSMTFLSIKGPELINMFVGQSEENIREVFSRARVAAPCVVFFDELDSLAPSRGRSGDSGGVMDRVVSQLLAELDGLHTTRGVFVIGATNRPDLLDQALLRPGRFDKLVYVGISSDRESQLQVLKAITAKFHLEPGVCLDELLDRGPSKLSGADLYALCSEAMTAAVKRKIALISNGLDREDSPLLLSSEDFSSALKSLQPSVSDQELLKYEYILQKLTAK